MIRIRVLIAALLVGSAAISPAQGADAYRYWSYWQLESGTWQYAKLGPAMVKATDGAVDGWRYGVGTVQTSTPPDIEIGFTEICGNEPQSPDSVRVAVVIDYGTAADAPAPRAACAVIARGLTRASALAAVSPLRLNQGFVCGIDNYPRTGCGEAVAPTDSAPMAAATASPSASKPTASPSPRATAASPAGDVSESADTGSTSSDAPIASASPTSTQPTAEPATAADEPTSPLPTIVTTILATIALLLALRNARLQKSARQ